MNDLNKIKKIKIVLVKDNNSDLASRRCSHDPYVCVFYSRSADLDKIKASHQPKLMLY